MKWMGGWNWDDYNTAPPDIIDEIVVMINEEQEQIAAASR